MNIQTVAENLRNTIAGKEQMLASVQLKAQKNLGNIDAYVTGATIGFLEINIGELKKILADVEQCRPDWNPLNCPYAAAETCHRMD